MHDSPGLSSTTMGSTENREEGKVVKDEPRAGLPVMTGID